MLRERCCAGFSLPECLLFIVIVSWLSQLCVLSLRNAPKSSIPLKPFCQFLLIVVRLERH